MELRRILFCLAVVLLGVVSHCSLSDARVSRHRRETDEAAFDESFLGDAAASDDEAQNDDGGNDEDDAPLNATILNKPEHFTVAVGKAVRLECSVNIDSVIVSWFKDDELYTMGHNKMAAPERAYIEPNTNNLVIQDLKPSDSGRYRCQLMLDGDDQETSTSIEHTIAVQEPPKILLFEASKKNLTEGEELLLTCNATGSPKPTLLWAREVNGVNHKLTEQDGEFSNNTFYIKSVKKDMSGRYYCYAISTPKSSQAFVDIKISGKPRVHVHRNVINSAIGVEAILECTVHDEGIPTIQWYKDNLRIGESNRFVISTRGSHSNLTVIPQADEDFGTFTCVARNEVGEHSRSIELVQSPVVEGFDVEGTKLNWIVHSHQPIEAIEVRLRKHGESDKNQWRIFSVQPPPYDGDHYKYAVTYVAEKLEPGQYEAEVRVRNSKDWSRPTEPKFITIETQAEPIQTASVYSPGSGAPTVSPSATFMSTALIYLLVRTL